MSDFSAASVPEGVQALVALAEGDVFFAAIGAVSPLRLLPRLLGMMGPLGLVRFVKDRQGMVKGGTVRPPQGSAAVAVLTDFLTQLDATLSTCEWLQGSEPGYADFAAYHPLWLNAVASGKGVDSRYPHVTDWYQRVSQLGQGPREELAPADCFAIARDAVPRAVPDSDDATIGLGTVVSVAPGDYGRDPVSGTLVALTANRIVVARETAIAGTVHVHFPRQGYQVTPQ